MSDISQLASQLVPFLAPSLPYLLKASEKAADLHPLPGEFFQAQDAGTESLRSPAAALMNLVTEVNQSRSPERFKPLCPHARVVAEAVQIEGLEVAGPLWDGSALSRPR
jgi:hypothetical protein